MRLTLRLCRDLSKVIDYYSRFNPSPLSIKQFLDFGESASSHASFMFLRKELPVRLCNIMKEIQLLPPELLRMPSVIQVQSWYERSLSEIVEFEDKRDIDDKLLEEFTETLTKVRNRHSSVVETMAQGIIELKQVEQPDVRTEHNIQYFLDRFYMSRISIRMLINQHCSLFGSTAMNDPRHVGVIDPKCQVADVVLDAFENAKFLCDQYYLNSPNAQVEQLDTTTKTNLVQVVYVPSHLYHICFELFKNAMRAVVEHYGADADAFPVLNILVVKGHQDITIKISDRGGGITHTVMENLFQYMYSTAPQPSQSEMNSAPLAGYGYGLPLARLYARYFQGDLRLSSIEGYGTDALVYLKALSNDANEMLPIFNKASCRHYSAPISSHDWSHSTANQMGPVTTGSNRSPNNNNNSVDAKSQETSIS